MTRRQHILTLLAVAFTLFVGVIPAQAARLATVGGRAQGDQVTQSDGFVLGGQQTTLTLSYNITGQNGCNVQVRIRRKLPNGRWSLTDTPVRTQRSVNGSRQITLPAGEYQIVVVASNAQFTVTIDN